MAKSVPNDRFKPATTPQARESQIASLAYDLAEELIRNKTATSQLITEFIRMGSTQAELQREHIRKQNELAAAKIEALEAGSRVEALIEDAISALKGYGGGKVL